MMFPPPQMKSCVRKIFENLLRDLRELLLPGGKQEHPTLVMREMKFTTRLARVSLCVYISVYLPQSICKCVYSCISLYLLASLYIPDWKCFSVCTYMHAHLWVRISAYVPMCGPVSTSVSMQLCILFLCDLWVCFWYELFCLSVCVGGGGYLCSCPCSVCVHFTGKVRPSIHCNHLF